MRIDPEYYRQSRKVWSSGYHFADMLIVIALTVMPFVVIYFFS